MGFVMISLKTMLKKDVLFQEVAYIRYLLFSCLYKVRYPPCRLAEMKIGSSACLKKSIDCLIQHTIFSTIQHQQNFVN